MTIDVEKFRTALLEERGRLEDAIGYLHRETPGSLEDETQELALLDGPERVLLLLALQQARLCVESTTIWRIESPLMPGGCEIPPAISPLLRRWE